jgi:uncharacterized membrane protein YqhA
MALIEKIFEAVLWRSRYIVLLAVIASMASAFAIFFMTTTDVVYLVQHIVHYADAGTTDLARKTMHDTTITHVVEVVDGFLLGTVMLIFALGLYELFISEIDEAKGSKASSKILVIENLDDLKQRLAKVIIMIMIVTIFELTIKVTISSPVDLLYLAGALALIGLALYLTHASDDAHEKTPDHTSH